VTELDSGKDDPVKLWQRLYSAIWLAFFCCALVPATLGAIIGPPVHALLGLAMLAIAATNAAALAKLPVPARLQRVSKTSAGLSGLQLVLGVALGAVTHFIPEVKIAASVLSGAHLVVGLAILAQSASVATGYDMWEEKEFEVKKA